MISRPHVHHVKRAEATAPKPTLFDSFWLGGFESACQRNMSNERIDMLAVTQHDVQCEGDYALMRSVGIRTVRDGIRWPLIEKTPHHYDFSSFAPMLRAANATGIQPIFNLMHYGWPDDLEILSSAFVERFAAMCAATARVVKSESDRVPIYVPINEISFLAWGLGTACVLSPKMPGKDTALKRQLVRAAIAAMDAVWEVEPRARFAHVDPVINVVAPRNRPDKIQQAIDQRNGMWESWDMLAGRRDPELGGQEKYLDIVGVNYYHSNQWETPDLRMPWEDEPRDDRWVPFHRLLDEVWMRYRKPLFIAETSHFGSGRAKWLREIAQEVYIARMMGVPLEGVCLYPVIDRPDWENLSHWHNSGLFDFRESAGGRLERVINEEYAESLRAAQALLAEIGCV